MNLLLLKQEDFIKGSCRARISGRRHDHIVEVLKSSPGDKLCVGALGGMMGTGEVLSTGKDATELTVKLDTKPPAKLPLNLILALPRPIVLKRLLLSITTMGVKKIFLIQTARVEKSFWHSPVLSKEAVEERLMLGLEQAKDTMLPEVHICKSFKAFAGKELKEVSEGTTALIAHPEASSLPPRDIKGAVTLAIGPEGGFIPGEMEAFASLGFKAFTLGARILKVETAVPFLISKFF